MNKFLHLILTVAFLTVSSLSVSAMDFSTVDRLINSDTGYAQCKKELTSMLGKATAASDKAEVLWRLARVQVLMGMMEVDKDTRRKVFAEGVEYAKKAIETDSRNVECYMWHCAATGRECQTHPKMEQAAAVPVMMDDLASILNRLGRVNFSEAWHALAEIYYNHPFKSNDSAINFMRQAVRSIPEGECRLCSCNLLATMLIDRDWSAEKRAEVASKNVSKASKATENIEKYSYLDGMLGSNWKCPWGGKTYGSISDKQEATAVLAYAAQRYKAIKSPSRVDQIDYSELVRIQSKLK